MRLGLAMICLVGAGPVCADGPVRFDYGSLAGADVWPMFNLESIQCLFPAAVLAELTVPTRFDDSTSPGIVWMRDGEPLIVFEASGLGPNVFSIWTEHPDVTVPNGWQVGTTTLAEVQATLGTCIRGYTVANTRVVCGFPDALNIPGSFVFKSVPGIESSPSGTYDASWGDARLSRLERYRGDAPLGAVSCLGTS